METRVSIVEVDQVRKVYGGVVTLDGVSLRVERAEVVGILGPNGAGKTTTVECVVGLRRPDLGRVRVFGLDPATGLGEIRQRVGVKLQQAVLPDRMKVREAMAVFSSAYRKAADPSTLLVRWGLLDQRDKSFKALSGGQRQRLLIALALLGQPELVVLDELTTGLDPAARRETWVLCDRLVVIHRGKVVAEGTPTRSVAGIEASRRRTSK